MSSNPSRLGALRAFGDGLSCMFRYWGKARPPSPTGPEFHLLVYHSLDVAAVAHCFLLKSPALRRFLMQRLNAPSERALLSWIAFWIALHDLGKFFEAFQAQCPEVFRQLRGRDATIACAGAPRHDSLGMLFWRGPLSERAQAEAWFGPDTGELLLGLDHWMRATQGHHGQPPKIGPQGWLPHLHRKDDPTAIVEFVARARALLLTRSAAQIPARLGIEHFYEVSAQLSWWIAGLTVLCDWLGSNTDYFPYVSQGCDVASLARYWRTTKRQACAALQGSGVLRASEFEALSFTTLFPLIETPSPLQQWVTQVSIARSPQIFLLEDVTGAGKTEAALTLAHRLMVAGCADGFFIGMPTMATANAMYTRLAGMYRKLFPNDASLVLAESQRHLVETFAQSIVPSGPSEDDRRQIDATATARCTAWLADHNKRALLAPAGVGTVDQALLAVLRSKHQSLRLLGLFRKVLIVDEVHACDAYMQAVLEVLLEFHASSGGSAILLSATLPSRMKEALLSAFAQGCGSQSPAVSDDAYPLVTRWSGDEPDRSREIAIGTRAQVTRTVAVRRVSDPQQVIDAIQAALAAGECVCWMRNTVADALAAYRLFQGAVPADRLTLFHARFALDDRLHLEEHIRQRFGEGSTSQQRSGQLVIATQVVEQSLDVDWDFVVTDLAPIDRIIQRLGRLQRHARGARRDPCLWVFGPSWSEDPPPEWYSSFLPRAARVYPHHGHLWLTARALRRGYISMPQDCRALIEEVFGEDAQFPSGLQTNALEREGEEYAHTSIAQQNTLKRDQGYVLNGLDWWGEAKAPSRLGEATQTVMLARCDASGVHPWVEGAHCWDYSSVRVPERLIARRATDPDGVREQAIANLMQSLPGKGHWSILLPLSQSDDGWCGHAWTAPNRKSAERRLRWRYDPATGLELLSDRDAEGD